MDARRLSAYIVLHGEADCFLFIAVLVVTQLASGEDWQQCKPDGSYSFVELKNLVRSGITIHGYSGWHEKAFSRAGDLTAVAILQSVSDTEMKSPETQKVVLSMLQLAFECPHQCVLVTDDQQPRITLLLLDHLQHTAIRGMQARIEAVKRFVIQQASDTK